MSETYSHIKSNADFIRSYIENPPTLDPQLEVLYNCTYVLSLKTGYKIEPISDSTLCYRMRDIKKLSRRVNKELAYCLGKKGCKYLYHLTARERLISDLEKYVKKHPIEPVLITNKKIAIAVLTHWFGLNTLPANECEARALLKYARIMSSVPVYCPSTIHPRILCDNCRSVGV